MLSGDMNISNTSAGRITKILLGRRAAFAWTLVLIAGFTVLDLNLPLGVAAGVPYSLAVMSALRTSNIRFILGITLIGVTLTLFGLLLSPDGGETWKVIANRLLAVGVIIGAGYFPPARSASAGFQLVRQSLLSKSDVDECRKLTSISYDPQKHAATFSARYHMSFEHHSPASLHSPTFSMKRPKLSQQNESNRTPK